MFVLCLLGFRVQVVGSDSAPPDLVSTDPTAEEESWKFSRQAAVWMASTFPTLLLFTMFCISLTYYNILSLVLLILALVFVHQGSVSPLAPADPQLLFPLHVCTLSCVHSSFFYVVSLCLFSVSQVASSFGTELSCGMGCWGAVL